MAEILSPTSKTIDHSINNEDIQYFLSEQLAGVNPFAVRLMAMHPGTFYQRPQIKHDSELIVSPIPYGFVETPLAPVPSSNAIDTNERYKRNAKSKVVRNYFG